MDRFSRPAAVALISAATLSYEILLVRVFAIEQFHHFAFMAIGVAMLGFGVGGVVLALARPGPRSASRGFAIAALLTPVALVFCTALVHRIDLDATQLAWNAGAWLRLGGVYLLLAVPFFVGGLVTLLALTLEPQRVGWIYGASFVGAGVGALLAIAVLWIVLPEQAVAVPALIASLGAVSAVTVAERRHVYSGLAVVVFVVTCAAVVRPPWTLEVTPYKGLPQVEAFPAARRVAERTSPLGWVVAVEASAFRHAPGLSLSYIGAFPGQTALFVDGQIAGAVSDWPDDTSSLQIVDWIPTAAPYALGGRLSVLVLGAGGGIEVWNALEHGASSITAVELNSQIVELAGWGSASYVGEYDAEVQWVIGDARGFMARMDEFYDLVAVGPALSFGSSTAGVHALNEDFMHTVEAYTSYIESLSENGVLAITRWLMNPPRESVRVILTAAEALRRTAPENIIDKLVVVRSWATVTVLVKPSGFRSDELHPLMGWASERRFDLDWYPGIEGPGAGYNILDEPTLYRAAAAAVGGRERADQFAAEYAFEVSPSDDVRPYPHHFLRVGSIRAFVRQDRGSWLAFAEWGYVALFATLVQSIALATLLLLLPAAVRVGVHAAGRWARLVGYFSAIGFAYLAAEIAAIQQLNLLLGHPVYAVAAVLAAFLVCSGLGSVWSDRLSAERAWWIVGGLAALLVLYGMIMLSLVHRLQPAPLPLRALAAMTLLAPLAFLMGTPFPLGLRSLAGARVESVAWGWAANGFASVVATPLAALIALESGSRVLLLAAAAAYAAAAVLQRGVIPRPAVEVSNV